MKEAALQTTLHASTSLAPASDLDAALDFATQAVPVSTQRVYRCQWSAFERYCAAANIPSLPASPEAVAAYIASRAKSGASVATVEQSLAAIAYRHRAARLADPTASAEVKLTRRGIRRALGVAPAKKSAATLSALERMIAKTDGDGLRATRDRALLAVGMAGGFRRSELVALDVADVEDDRRGTGLRVRVRRGKTDQEGHGHTKAIPFGDGAVDPAGLLRAWLRAAGIASGAVFRSVDRHGNVRASRLDGHSVARIVKEAAERAGLDARAYSGHSLRRGFVTQAALDGADTRAIIRQTRQTERTAFGYIDEADPFADNAVVGMFKGRAGQGAPGAA